MILARLLLLSVLCTAASPLEAQTRRLSGFSLGAYVGLGGSHFSYVPDPAYERSGMTLLRFEATQRLWRSLALTIQGTSASDFGHGDCIGIDPICAPAFSYKALSAAVSFLPGRTAGAGGPLLSVGAGLHRLPESVGNWGHSPIPASTVFGLQASAELPLSRKPLGLGVGVQGAVLPNATGRAIYIIHLFVGWRAWFARSQ